MRRDLRNAQSRALGNGVLSLRIKGVQQLYEFVDERQGQWCIHCGCGLSTVSTSRDHVPSKTLLGDLRPDDLPTVAICRTCNTSFSLDEQYVATFIGCVLSGSTDPADQGNPRVARTLRAQPALKARIEQSRTEYRTLGGETKVVWKPDLDRLHRVTVKNARGHVFFECGEPIFGDPRSTTVVPYQALSANGEHLFEQANSTSWGEVGSRMMTRLVSGQDLIDGWVVVEPDVYRYVVELSDDVTSVKTVVNEYLATEVIWQL